MNNFTLKQLRYFHALADQGHFGRAAEVCAISQPALSMQIKELEQELGMTLFERGGRQVHLTAQGEEVAAHVQRILAAVDELGTMAHAGTDGQLQRLRIGVIPTVAPYLLPRLIPSLTARFPGLDLRVRETLTATLIDELIQGRLDAAIVALPLSDPRLLETPLFQERFILVRPEADAPQPVPSRDALREMRLLLLEEGHCFRDQALSFCNLPSRPREVLDGSSLTTLVQMVGAGVGVTLIPEIAVDVETRSANVSTSMLPDPQPTRTVGIVWRKTSPLAGAFSDISDVIKAAGQAVLLR